MRSPKLETQSSEHKVPKEIAKHPLEVDAQFKVRAVLLVHEVELRVDELEVDESSRSSGNHSESSCPLGTSGSTSRGSRSPQCSCGDLQRIHVRIVEDA